MGRQQDSMMKMLGYGRHSVGEDDMAAVREVLSSDFLTQGPQVEAFEQEFAARVGAAHAVAVSNATAALHLAMLVADIGPGDRVVTTPLTFLASANGAAYVGATVDFCDIDPFHYNMDASLLEQQWRDDTKAVVAVAYAGQACDMPAIAKVARQRGAWVIEDACHGVGGGFWNEEREWCLGGHPWADMTTFSFHPVKTMTTGEGGMLVTQDATLAQRARLLRSHGVTRDPNHHQDWPIDDPLHEKGPWYYEMQELGYNFRLSDLQCALGRSQLRKLDGWIARRREIVRQYQQAFASLSWLRCPSLRDSRDESLISWHLFSVWMDFPALGRTRSQVMQQLRESGVGTQVLYIPVHLQPWYRRSFGYQPGKCPNAESVYAGLLSLPLFPAMTDADVARVIVAVLSLGSRS